MSERPGHLCHQSLAWDARPRHPLPLHVAGAVDRAHPDYHGPSLEVPGLGPDHTTQNG
ncbi:RNaseH domain-containing protein [Streptomyces sp. VNUA116]|uniref:RNaseH domain-containing protein n=1 Tax=Streptomyces sp. VNUA116 TaxID=3062449 RepID=UPI0034A07658